MTQAVVSPGGGPNGRPRVSERQALCLYWVQEGKSATDIGAILGISRRTVEWHLEQVCLQLGVRTRLQAVLRARELGLVPTDTPGSLRGQTP